VKLRFASLGSGSKGNGTLVEFGATRILIDCGFFLREAEARLRRFGVEPDTLSAILVTHEHHDHIGGVSRLARKFKIPVWMTNGTHAGWEDPYVPQLTHFNPHEAFTVGDIEVQPFPVPHDAREPSHFVFKADGRRLGVVSDAGSVTPFMRQNLSGCDALMLEFNYDPEMLLKGPYPPKLQKRVSGEFGHLSNAQAAELLVQIDRSRLQHLVLTHLSEKNNTPGLALSAAAQAIDDAPPWLVCAHQARGLEWREIA
jgi:phosphoribosyl 1,2-cyclic phosphodiesterase